MSLAPLSTPIVSLIIASLVLQPTLGWTQSAEDAADRALQQRMQREVLGKDESEKGESSLRKKDYEMAFAHYKNACDNIFPSDATKSSRAVAVAGLTISGRKLAEQRVSEGYYASAVQALQEVLKQNPDDKGTLKLLANIEAPDYFNKKMTPGHRANIEKVKQLFLDAENYKQLGKNDLALLKFEEILNIDKDNIAARKGLEEIYTLKDQPARAGYAAARARQVWAVDHEWDLPIRRFDRKAVVSTTSTKSNAPSTRGITDKLNKIILPKIDFKETTVREAIEFLVQKSKQLDDAHEGVNIVLKLDDQGGSSAPAPAPAPAAGGIPGLDVPGAAPAGGGVQVASGGSGTRITLTLNNVPLIEVIKYITNLANLKFKIEPFAVQIVPIGADVTDMFIKEWRVPASLFRETPGASTTTTSLTAAPSGGADASGAGGSGLSGSSNAKDFLAARGVTFGQGAFAMYSTGSSALVVKNSQDQLDLVERVIEVQDEQNSVKQIEVQAKFVEITQNNLKELSFDWLLGQANVPGSNKVFLGGGTSGTSPQTSPSDFPFSKGGLPVGNFPITGGNRSGNVAISASAIDALLFGTKGASALAPGVLALTGASTDPVFQVVMRALDQKKGVDLLSAPHVTTKSGARAVIEVIREFRYPTEFSEPQIPQTFGNQGNGGGTTILGGAGGLLGTSSGGSSGTFPVTPSTPSGFETRNTGVTLEVEPNLNPDGVSIEMQLAPQVVEFEGFINYGSPIQTTSTNLLGQQVVNVITPNIINQPIFSTRKVTTNVTVLDGATVMLGGLIREDVQKVEDKTPFLGDIPVLGRLFRSNVDQHIKRNLIIFVSARVVNAEGQPVSNDDEKEEKVDELPLPDIAPPGLPDLGGYSKNARTK